MKSTSLHDRRSSPLTSLCLLLALLALLTPAVHAQLVNTAYGTNALHSNTTGNDNAAFGNSALFSNTTADYNVAFGNDALYTNTTGTGNTGTGHMALYFNTTGTYNIGTGYAAPLLQHRCQQQHRHWLCDALCQLHRRAKHRDRAPRRFFTQSYSNSNTVWVSAKRGRGL